MRGTRWIRFLWFIAPFFLFVAVISRITELRRLGGILAGADPVWLLIIGLLQVSFTVNQGAFYRAIFRLLNTEVALSVGVQLALVVSFAGQASPAGTAMGIAYFVAVAQAHGLPSARAFLGSLLYYVYDYASFLIVLVLGLGILLIHRDLTRLQVITVAVFLVLVSGLAVLVVWALLVRQAAVVFAKRLAQAINRVSVMIRRRPLVAVDDVRQRLGEIAAVLVAAARTPPAVLRPVGHALLVELLSLGILAGGFLALDYPVHPGVLVAGYAIGVLFSIMSVTPSGVGVVEGAMTVVFTSLAVPLETAVAATLLYRLFTLWLPLLAGFVLLRFVLHRR